MRISLIINIKQIKMKRKIKITEQDLHRIVENCVNEALEEGWKNLALTGAIGAASLFPQNGNAQQVKQTYNYRTPNAIRYQNASTKQDSLLADKIYDNDDYITNHPMSEKELASIFPQAYKDRNANPQVWKQNQTQYCGEVYGKNSIVGKIAASKGENPWQAILNKYSKLNYQNKQNDVFATAFFDDNIIK